MINPRSPFWVGLLLLVFLGVPGVEGGVGFWTSIGPQGANVRVILIAPSAIYLGTNGGSIFLSVDHGAKWKKIFGGAADTAIADLAVVNGSLYAAVRSTVAFAVFEPPWGPGTPPPPPETPGTGVFRSSDGGRSWSLAGLDKQSALSFAIDPRDPSTIYVVTDRGLNRSRDGGVSWETIFHSDETREVLSVAVDSSDSAILYLGTTIGGYKSVDRGDSFRSMLHPDPSCKRYFVNCSGYLATDLPPKPVSMFLGDPASPRNVYALMLGQVFQTLDAGETWIQAGGLSGVSRIALDPSHPGRIYAVSPAGLFSRSVSSVFWSPLGPPPQGLGSFFAMAVDAQTPSRLYLGTQWGPFRSEDSGASWTSLNETLRDLTATAFSFDPSDPSIAYVAQYQRGILKTTDAGRTWSVTGFSDPEALVESILVDPFDPRHLLAFTSEWISGRIPLLRSTDGGVTWTRGPAIFNDVLGEPHVLIADPTLPGSLYLGNHSSVFITRSGGLSWASAALQKPASGTSGVPVVFALAADPRHPGVAYAGGRGGLFRTDDRGSSWQFLFTNLDEISSLAFAARDPFPPLAVTPSGLFDLAGGLLWDSSVSQSRVLTSVAVDSSSGAIYVTTAGGVFRSFDSGISWQPLGEGLPASLSSGVSVHPKDGCLAVVTQSGVYAYELPDQCLDSLSSLRPPCRIPSPHPPIILPSRGGGG